MPRAPRGIPQSSHSGPRAPRRRQPRRSREHTSSHDDRSGLAALFRMGRRSSPSGWEDAKCTVSHRQLSRSLFQSFPFPFFACLTVSLVFKDIVKPAFMFFSREYESVRTVWTGSLRSSWLGSVARKGEQGLVIPRAASGPVHGGGDLPTAAQRRRGGPSPTTAPPLASHGPTSHSPLDVRSFLQPGTAT